MIIFHLLSAHGGVIQEYPYFSHEVIVGDKDAHRPMQNVNRHKMSKNMFFTFDPASVRALKEFIWIDHQ
jgi:hypothetical protein